MRVSLVSNNYNNTIYNSKVKKAQNSSGIPAYSNYANADIKKAAPVSFSGLMRLEQGLKPIDSSFFRDYPTLMSTVSMLRENFPEGAEILDYACSDGEEAISLYALLGEARDDFKITGIDLSEDAIGLANQGIYSLFGGGLDSYLMDGAKKDETEKYLSKLFYEIMKPSCEPDEPLNNTIEFNTLLATAEPKFRKQIFLKPKNEVKENLEFKTGDIYKMDKEAGDKKVGAILFRNAFYHLMDSMEGDELFAGKLPEGLRNFYKGLSSNGDDDDLYSSSKEKSLAKKQAIADEIVDKVYDKLEVGGVFVLGDALNENVFIAPESAPEEDTIRFGDTKAYEILRKNMNEALLYYKKAQGALSANSGFNYDDLDMVEIMEDRVSMLKEQADMRILKKTPVHKALEKDGRFKPVHTSQIQGLDGVEMPTVWVKVK